MRLVTVLQQPIKLNNEVVLSLNDITIAVFWLVLFNLAQSVQITYFEIHSNFHDLKHEYYKYITATVTFVTIQYKRHL
jgi:hypothetical protein